MNSSAPPHTNPIRCAFRAGFALALTAACLLTGGGALVSSAGDRAAVMKGAYPPSDTHFRPDLAMRLAMRDAIHSLGASISMT